jgi:hypothetical protein
MVTYTCNPNYSGGRDPEDCSTRPVQKKSYQDLMLTKQTRCGGAPGGIDKRIPILGQLQEKSKSLSEKKNLKPKGSGMWFKW